MLPKKNRADKKAVEKIFKEGKFLNSLNLTFKYIKIRGTESFLVGKDEASCPLLKLSVPRISVIAPKSIAKLAVKRNLLRRRGYDVLGKYINQFPLGIWGVFVFKKYQDDVLIIENEIKNILSKIN
jgi:ribonuclease P protein component